MVEPTPATISAALRAAEGERGWPVERRGAWKHVAATFPDLSTMDWIHYFVEHEFWFYRVVVCDLLRALDNEGQRTAALLAVTRRARGDMAAGPIWKTIQEVGGSKPEEALRMAAALIDQKEFEATFVSALLLSAVKGPHAALDPGTLMLATGAGRQQAGLVLGWLMTSEGKLDPGSLRAPMERLPIPSDPDVRKYYAPLFFRCYAGDPAALHTRLLALLATEPGELEGELLIELSTLRDVAPGTLIVACNHALERHPLPAPSSVANILGTLYPSDKQFVLDWLENLLRSHGFDSCFSWPGSQDLMDQIRKVDLDSLFDRVESLLREPIPLSPPLVVGASGLLRQFYVDDLPNLIAKTRTWNETAPGQHLVRLEILRDIIGGEEKHGKPDLLKRCLEEVELIIQGSGRDLKTLLGRERDARLRALKAIDALLNIPQTTDYAMVRKALDAAPSLKKFIDGDGWIAEQEAKGVKWHPLFQMLENGLVSETALDELVKQINSAANAFERISLLQDARYVVLRTRILPHFEDVFSRLLTESGGIASLRAKVRNAPQTLAALSEAEIISQLSKTSKVEIEPNVRELAGPPDLQVHLKASSPIIEVYHPNMNRLLFLAPSVGFVDRELADRIVSKKAKKQYSIATGLLKTPVILAVDTEDAFQLEFGVAFSVLDGVTFRTRATGGAKGSPADGIELQDEGTDNGVSPLENISGVLFFKRDLSQAPAGKLVGHFVPNLGAAILLGAADIAELETALFGKPAPRARPPPTDGMP